MKFLTLDDVDVGGKRVFIRADLNCPVQDGIAQNSQRLVEHAKTIYELSQKGAKVVVLAHQGREGKDDFISLQKHSALLSSEISKLSGGEFSVLFIDDVAGEKAKTSIESLESGQVLLLDNVRFLKSETEFAKTHKSELIDNLAPLCDIFVLDAFSVSHRSQASVIGFENCVRVAGRVMQKELEALSKFENPKKPTLLILGGAKPADSLPILQEWIETKKADKALCAGAMGNLMLVASGRDIGEKSTDFLKSSGSYSNLAQLTLFFENHKQCLIIPSDVVVSESGAAKTILVSDLPSRYSIFDIGRGTIHDFRIAIESAGSIILNGPMGVYEKDEFSHGTKEILEAIVKSSAFSLLGGGHTLSALEKFGISHDKFGYVSLSGKALVEYLSGQELPGVKYLQTSASPS